ncbi:MAG TPA: MCE family protein [Kiloniellaceae bacterium]|nr:MCE family protein [Kiloniellaceae bacterium]
MRHQGLNYALVGGFVIAMLAAAVAAMIALSGGAGPRDHYTIVFDNVADVKFGTQVRYEGFPVGQVEAIEPVAENGAMAFHLDVSVQKGWVIPADSVARIHSSKFLAAKTVEITRGESPTSLSPRCADRFCAERGHVCGHGRYRRRSRCALSRRPATAARPAG